MQVPTQAQIDAAIKMFARLDSFEALAARPVDEYHVAVYALRRLLAEQLRHPINWSKDGCWTCLCTNVLGDPVHWKPEITECNHCGAVQPPPASAASKNFDESAFIALYRKHWPTQVPDADIISYERDIYNFAKDVLVQFSPSQESNT